MTLCVGVQRVPLAHATRGSFTVGLESQINFYILKLAVGNSTLS